jgi:hypothetical protein
MVMLGTIGYQELDSYMEELEMILCMVEILLTI